MKKRIDRFKYLKSISESCGKILKKIIIYDTLKQIRKDNQDVSRKERNTQKINIIMYCIKTWIIQKKNETQLNEEQKIEGNKIKNETYEKRLQKEPKHE